MNLIRDICKAAKKAANSFTQVSEEQKNKILLLIKDEIKKHKDQIMSYNQRDIQAAKKNGKNTAFIDRLTMTPERIAVMCDGLEAVAMLKDPVGEVEESYTLKNGLQVSKVRSPLGVVGIIYEARPNVTVDAAALCIKSSNAVILRGSKDAMTTNAYLVELMKGVLKRNGFDSNLIGFIDGESRERTKEFLRQGDYVDVIIPRGGEALKKFVLEWATMPVIASAGGNCHNYVESSADFDMAKTVIINAKLNRPSVCNALETLLCDRKIAKEFLPHCLSELKKLGVEIRGDKEVKQIFEDTIEVEESEFYKEYNDKIIKVKIVSGIDEAIEHINTYGTNHSEAILTKDMALAKRFTREVDSAAVYVNASTRFTDGFELGLGAEMGISTQKLHIRGPIGIKELTSLKFVISGNGQIRT